MLSHADWQLVKHAVDRNRLKVCACNFSDSESCRQCTQTWVTLFSVWEGYALNVLWQYKLIITVYILST